MSSVEARRTNARTVRKTLLKFSDVHPGIIQAADEAIEAGTRDKVTTLFRALGAAGTDEQCEAVAGALEAAHAAGDSLVDQLQGILPNRRAKRMFRSMNDGR